jgi:hypothetical protein
MASSSPSIRPSLSLTINWSNSFAEFENVLQGHHRTAWKQVLHEHFPEPIDATEPVPAKQDRNLEENFHQAIQLFIQQMLNKKSLGIGSISIYSLAETMSSRSQ